MPISVAGCCRSHTIGRVCFDTRVSISRTEGFEESLVVYPRRRSQGDDDEVLTKLDLLRYQLLMISQYFVNFVVFVVTRLLQADLAR